MKDIIPIIIALIVALVIFQVGAVVIDKKPQATPNANLALEARVTTLEGQVKELRRVVGIDKGLSEGLQNRGKKK